MGRKLLYCTACLLLFISTLYIFTNYVQFDERVPNFEYFRDQTENAIPEIVIFQSHHDLRLKTGKCKRAFHPREITVHHHGKWQKVGTDPEWYIYSAYVDNRLDASFVRILAMAKGSQAEKLFCRTWYKTGNSSVTEIQKNDLWIHAWDFAKFGQYYQPFLLSCPVSSDPTAMSIVSDPCELPKMLINMTSSPTIKNTTRDFVICIKPMKFHKDISFRLLEWLELQLLFGAERIFVYVYKVHPQTWRVLKHYERAGKVVLQTYDLPKEVQQSTKGGWQKRRHEMIVYNDCFYKHIHSHRFVVNVDMDEVHVPVLHDTWLEMLKNASIEDPRLQNSASLSGSNVYFFDSFGESNDSSVPRYMHMLRHVHRSANFTPPGFAQKSFFSTNLTLMVSNHFALRTLRPQVRLLSAIDTHLVHLHHYRKDCPPLMESDCEINFMKFRTRDSSLWRFKDKLVKSVREKVREIGLSESYSSEIKHCNWMHKNNYTGSANQTIPKTS